MMCTAAVCHPISPSSPHLLGFRQEQVEEPDEYSSPSSEQAAINGDKQWSRTTSGKGLARLWLDLPSPASAMTDVISYSPKFTLLRSPLSRQFPNKINFIRKLPIELSLSILQLLSDEDLCNICLVCREWYHLSQDHPLLIRRKTFVHSQRILFKQSKENFSHTSHSSTPPGPSSRARSSLSPLCPIGNICSPPLSVAETPRQLEYNRNPRSAPGSADSARFHSSMSSVVDSVERLSIKGGAGDTRRCLFPGIEPTPGKTRRMKESTTSSLPRQHRQPPYRLSKNKETLRRL